MTTASFAGGVVRPWVLPLFFLAALCIQSTAHAGGICDGDSAPPAAPKADPTAAMERREAIEEARTSPLDDLEFKGDVTIPPGTTPYSLQGEIKLTSAATITMPGGVEIRGGVLDLGTKGHIVAKGEKGRPVIFRHVTFLQDLGASVTADNAVFDACTFGKGGVWFNAYSSKWIFNSCVLHACRFPRLTEVDYGFQLHNYALISMDFPEIKHPRNANFNHPAALHGEWNQITDCIFVDCNIPPTVCWCAQKSNFAACKFLPGEAFESDQPWEMTAYITHTVGRSPEEAWAVNAPRKSPVRLTKAETPFAGLSLVGFDAIIPELVLGEGGSVSVVNSRLK